MADEELTIESRRDRWRSLDGLADACFAAAVIVIVAGLAAGVGMIWMGGQVGDVGSCGFLDKCETTVYQYRPLGIVVLVLVGLLGPIALLAARSVRAWSRDQLGL